MMDNIQMKIEISNPQFKTNLKKRIFATIFDYGLYLLALSAYILFFGDDNHDGEQNVSGLLILPVFISWFIYFVVIEASYGATLGHQSFNLKVLTLDRKDIKLKHALRRHLLDPIDIFFYGIPAIKAIKNSDKHQRIGDMWANTLVGDTADSEQYLVLK
jgi:uncharacterized RDD family membrane protein YckC